MDLTEKTLSAQRVFEGRLIHVRHDQVCLPDGQKTVREVVEHPGGVAIAALTEEGQILLVDQFRYAQQRVMREVPAGKLERGEDPRKAALRELEEETGYRAEHIKLMGEFIPTGAYLEERIWMYFAWGLSFAGQHPDADEFLHVTKMDMEELVEQIMNGTIIDGKTIAMGLKLQRMLENSSAAKRKAATD